MIIKKWNTAGNGSWEEQYPKTLETMIYDSSATTTTLFENGKLKQNYLPDSVYGGMTFVGAISTTSTPSSMLELDRLIEGTMITSYSATQLDSFTGKSYSNGDYAGIGQRYIGHYWIVSTSLGSMSIADSSSSDEAEWGSAVFDDGQIPETQQTGQTNYLTLENGDWVIITGWDNTNSRWSFRVINNTYRGATTSNRGIVELATDTEVQNGTSTVLVASVKQIKDRYSLVNHLHSGDEVELASAYSNIGSSADDTLNDVFADIDSVLGTNISNISTNASNISTNTGNISTNTTNISNNTSNISTNTSNISTNSTNITSLQGRKEVFVASATGTAPTANQANDLWFAF